MIERRFVAGRIAVSVALVFMSAGAAAQEISIFSTFDADTPGNLPATGGPDQPTGIINGGVLVQSSANGIATQPLEVADSDCSASSFYFGGVYYDLSTPITGGVVRIEATVSANQITTGVFFDTGTDPHGPSVARLNFSSLGTIVDNFDVVLANYSANSPFRIRVDIDMNSKTWACTIDDELNGFEDDPKTSGLAFVNDPSLITQVGRVYLALFGSFNIYTCSAPRTIAYDDVLIVNPLIFADGFESGDTAAWSNTVDLSLATVNWYDNSSCIGFPNTDGPFASDYCVQVPGEMIYLKFDCTSGHSVFYWDDQCKTVRAPGCDSNLCCEVPFTGELVRFVWTCP